MAPKKEKDKKEVVELSFDEVTKLLRDVNRDTFQLFGEKEIAEYCTIEKIPTKNPALDYLLGGGITKGRVTCIAGEESAGKTTVTMEFIAEVVKDLKARNSFKRVYWNDVEGAFDPKRARQLGIDTTYVVVWREKVIEEYFAKIDRAISTGYVEAVVVDSLDNMIAAKVDDNAYKATMGGTAGALGQHLPNLFAKIIQYNVTTIFIKQAREKVGGFNPTGRTQLIINGGRTFKHDCDSIIILEKRSNKDCDGFNPVAARAMKTRSIRLGKSYVFSLAANGVDAVRDTVRLALDNSLLPKSGTWIYLGEDKFQGEENFIRHLRTSPDDFKKLWDQVYAEVINADVVLEAGEDEEVTVIED